jgi:hypothetical protein
MCRWSYSLFVYEYRRWHGIEVPAPTKRTTAEAGRLQALLGDYLRQGGLPEPLKYPS